MQNRFTSSPAATALMKSTNSDAPLSMGLRLCIEGLRAGTVDNVVDGAISHGMRGFDDEVALGAVEGPADVRAHKKS
jgi:hypothetical protein